MLASPAHLLGSVLELACSQVGEGRPYTAQCASSVREQLVRQALPWISMEAHSPSDLLLTDPESLSSSLASPTSLSSGITEAVSCTVLPEWVEIPGELAQPYLW